MRLKKILLLAVILFSFICYIDAQVAETGSMIGKVTDVEGALLPGVSVSIKSPALILPVMTSITNNKGYYRFPSLPIGFYTVTFEVDGFQTVIRENIRINFGRTINCSCTLEVQKLSEEVVVLGVAPTIDTQKTTLITNLTSEFISSLPSGRSLSSYFNMAPGITSSITHGSSAKENRYNLDGLNMADPMTGLQRWEFSIDIAEEISIQAGGLPVDHGNIRGAVVNVVTKSGGNDFHGSAQFYFRNVNMQADNTKGTPLEGQKTGFDYEYDTSVNIGGPIIKDKIWFFLNLGYKYSQSYVSGYPYDKPENTPIDNRYVLPYGKLTFQIDPNNKMTLAYNYHRWKTNHNSASYRYNEDATRIVTYPVSHVSLNYERIFNSNWMMNAKVGYQYSHTYQDSKKPEPRYYDSSTRRYSVGLGYDRILIRDRFQTLLSSVNFVDDWMGMHEFKAGLEFEYCPERHERSFHRDERGYGPYIYTRNDGEPYYVQFEQDFNRKDSKLMIGGFFQDSWQPFGRLTLNLGFRFDHLEGIVPEQGTEGKFKREPLVVDEDTVLDATVLKTFKPIIFNVITPRFGAAFDLTGDGKTLLKTSFGRYNSGLYFWHVDVNPNSNLAWRYRLNPDWSLDLDYGMYGVSGTANNIIDPDLKPSRLDEFIIGVERELAENLSFSARYIRKWDRNIVQDTDINTIDVDILMETGEIVWKNYRPVQVLDPFSGEYVMFYEKIDTSIPGQRYKTNPSEARRDYEGVEITLNKRLSHGWMLFASYVYSNSRGLINTGTGESSSTTKYLVDPNVYYNAIGRNPQERRHMFKLHSVIHAPFGIYLSGYFQALSGQRYTRRISSNDLGLDLNQGNVTIFAEQKGSSGYPAQYLLDLRIEKAFIITNIVRLGFIMDIFNVFNSNTTTGVETISSATNLQFEEIKNIIGARVVRLGVRLEF